MNQPELPLAHPCPTEVDVMADDHRAGYEGDLTGDHIAPDTLADAIASLAYPWRPGFKGDVTSAHAAVAMAPRAQILREKILGIVRARPCTADEAAADLGASILAVRPRFSELRKEGRIVPTTLTRPSSTGHSARVWQAV